MENSGPKEITHVYAFDTTGLHERRQDPVYQAKEILREKQMMEEFQALDKIKMGLSKRIFLSFFEIASFDETNDMRISYDPEKREYSFDAWGLEDPKYMKKRIEKYNAKLS